MNKARFLGGIFCVMIGLMASFILFPSAVFANGGDQRIVEGKYLINLARAPFTPRVGVQTAMLPAFFDMEKNKLVAEDLLVKVRIYRFGGSGEGKRVLLFEKKDIPVKGGVLEGLSYTFAEPGLHEVFFDFAFASSPQKLYEAPDFLLDVQKSGDRLSMQLVFIAGVMGAVFGFAFGWFAGLGKRK